MDEQVEARAVFDTLCEGLNQMNWKYHADEENLAVTFNVRGDDLPMEFVIAVDGERSLVRLSSPLPFRFKMDKRIHGAVATCCANYKLADGSFDFDIRDGEVVFRMTSSYRDSLVGPDMIRYMVGWATAAVDDYNDQFFMINQGALPLDEFIKQSYEG